MMQQIQAALFDLDGTLTNTLQDIADAMNRALLQHGLPTWTTEEYKYLVGDGVKILSQRAVRERQDLADAVRQTYQDWYGSHNQVTTRPYAGIPEMLAALKAQGIRLAVLSNKPHADTVHVVAHYFPDVVFDQVRGQQEGIPVKPDPTGALAVAQAMGEGRSSVCRMARVAGAQVLPVDVGMLRHAPSPGLLSRVVMEGGTWNMTQGPAMPREAAVEALSTGFSLAKELAGQGFRLLAAGEMGIGNTTTTAAVACALLGLTPEAAVGRGAGLSDEGLERKRRAVARALAVNRPDPSDPMDILYKVGGLDIASMTGFYLGCAAAGVPVILDGAISAAAALLAARLCPNAQKALLPSHRPSEPCGQALLDALGLEPILDGGFHLGEGTGAAALMPLLDMALAIYRDMTTFGGMGIGAYRPDGERVPAKAEPEAVP